MKLIERKELLKSILPENNTIKCCDHVEAQGVALFEHARKINLEGIIAKEWIANTFLIGPNSLLNTSDILSSYGISPLG